VRGFASPSRATYSVGDARRYYPGVLTGAVTGTDALFG
jgi:hypothetical protein